MLPLSGFRWLLDGLHSCGEFFATAAAVAAAIVAAVVADIAAAVAVLTKPLKQLQWGALTPREILSL